MRIHLLMCSLGAAFLTLGLANCAFAQGTDRVDPPDEEYGKGAELTPPEAYRSFRKTPPFRAFLPPVVDLSGALPLPRSQGKQGSCVAWAVGYAVRAYYTRTLDGRDNRRAENIPSPAYIYGAIKRDASCAGGSKVPLALDLLKTGSLSLAEVPYDANRCPTPDTPQRSRATQFRIKDWLSLDTRKIDQIKGELAQGHPVVFARVFAPSFDRHVGTGVYARVAGEPTKGAGHAIAIVGYDDNRQAVRIMNSWNPARWGDRGYAWVSYAEVTGTGTEAYVMRPEPMSRPPSPSPTPAPPSVVVVPPVPPLPTPVPTVLTNDVECAKVVLVQDGGKSIARGFVGKDEDVEKIRQRLRGQAADFDIAVHPWPQCEALLTLDNAVTAPDRPQVKFIATGADAKKGDSLALDVVAPQAPSHVHVAYIQADGSVVHLVQSDTEHMQTVDRGRQLLFGDGKEGRSRFVVGPPYGREMVIALASRSPIFPEPRPKSETEREFLTALRRALALRASLPEADRAVRAAYVTLVTKEN